MVGFTVERCREKDLTLGVFSVFLASRSSMVVAKNTCLYHHLQSARTRPISRWLAYWWRGRCSRSGNFHHKRNLDVDIYVRLRRVLVARHNKKVRVALRWRNCCQCEQKRLRGNTGLHHRSAALKAPAGSRVESAVVDVEFDAKNTSWIARWRVFCV